MPHAGLGMRPVNDAGASTSGQTGRKEAAGWGRYAGTPRTPPGALAGPLEPLAELNVCNHSADLFELFTLLRIRF
jgi:hypothetical protein